MTEEQLQASCFIWFHNEYHDERQMMHHNDNNSSDSLVGNKKKSLGVMKGVWDLEWISPNGTLIFLEAKVGNNKLTAEQKTFIARVQSRNPNVRFFVFYSKEEFQNIVKSIMNG